MKGLVWFSYALQWYSKVMKSLVWFSHVLQWHSNVMFGAGIVMLGAV